VGAWARKDQADWKLIDAWTDPIAAMGEPTGVDGVWNLGAGEPVAEVRGTAADLLLMLWHRISVDDAALSWAGDVDGLAATRGVVTGPLVP
jgi:hypothetical protein